MKDNSELLLKIKDDFEGVKPESDLKIHIGPMASVPAVIASEKKIAEMKIHA